ncbi:MAG: hypothetical protein ACRDE8_05360 [Ginsengibacter sp.]
MYKKLSNLGFVIGIFFTIISLILIIGGLLSAALAYKLNFYTGFSFLVFGLFMIFFNGNNRSNEKGV